MKNLLVLVTGCLLTVAVSAQQVENIEQKAQTIAQEVQTNGRYLSRDQRAEISRNLDSIRRILKGGSTFPTPPPLPPPPRPQPTSSYTCVSRDNDGADPYVFAIRDGIQVTRIAAANFSNLESCNLALNSIRYIGGKNILCLSRDNDGSSPYQVASLSGVSVSRIPKTVSDTNTTCNDMLNSFRPDRNNNVTFCISRDNDGAAPYVAAMLNLYGESLQTGTESFSSLTACKAFIGQ